MSEKIVLFTCRYMWKLKDSENVSFKIVTDTDEGLKVFEKALLSLENVENVCFEYLHEYDCSRLGVFVPVKENNESEVIDNEKV